MKLVFRTLCIMLLALSLTATAFAGVTDPIVNEPGTLPVVKEPLQLTVAIGQNATILDYDTNFQTLWVEDKTGVDIVWQLFPSADATEKMNTIVASGTKLPDIIAVGDLNIYGVNGAVIPLNDYYDDLGANFHARCEAMGYDPEWIINMCKHSDGNLYATPYFRSYTPDTMGWRQWINTVWLEKLGLEEPTTTDELLTVLRAFRDDDPNGNGIADEIPLIASTNGWNSNVFYFIQNMFIYYDSNGNYWLLDDNVLDVSYDKDEYRDALRFAHQLYEEGLLSPLSFTQSNTEYAAMASQETEIIGIGVNGSASGFSANRKDYEGVPCIAGPNGAQYATGSVALPGTTASISVDCEHPEAAFLFLNAFYNDDLYVFIDRWGEPGVDWDFAPEGAVSAFSDIAPGLTVIHDLWGQEQNTYWSYGFIPCLTDPVGSCLTPVWDGDTSTGESKNSRAIDKIKDFIPDASHRVARVTYTDEESTEWNETRTVIKSYVEECQARFITGDMDIESDWDQYLAELNNMRYKDLLAADQIAYNRTNGID